MKILPWPNFVAAGKNARYYDEFTLAETETGTDTEIDKIDTVPIKAHLY